MGTGIHITLRTIARPPGRDGPAVWAGTGARPYDRWNYDSPATVPAPGGSRLTGPEDKKRVPESRLVQKAYSPKIIGRKFEDLAHESVTGLPNPRRIKGMRRGTADSVKVSANRDSNCEIGCFPYATRSQWDTDVSSQHQSASSQKTPKTRKVFHRGMEIAPQMESMRYARRSMKAKAGMCFRINKPGARGTPKIGHLRLFYLIVNRPGLS